MEVFDMLPVMNRNLWMPEEFNDFFDTDFMPRVNATAPAINVKESEKDYTVELAAPGLTKDDFTVNVDNDGNLHIKIENKSNKKEEDKKSHYLRREFSYSKYEQTLLLPDDVEKEKIAATVNNGVLTVDLPKIEKKEEKTARQIEVK
jgi:HSP20 family protein